MAYDIAFRFQQALDPSALNTLPNCLHALSAAIDDCRNAGGTPDSDPAVILLARHLGALAHSIGGPDVLLRRQCMDKIADLRREPALIPLAHKGVAYDVHAKKVFHSEGRKALRRLADALGLTDDRYNIHVNRGGIAVSGEIMLRGDDLYVELSLGSLGRGQEVMYRRVKDRHDHCGDRNHFAAVVDLMNPDRLAARIRRDLHLPESEAAPARLVA